MVKTISSGDIMTLNWKAALAASVLVCAAGLAAANPGNDRGIGIKRVAGVFVASSTAEFIATPDGQTFECEFLIPIVPGLVCGEDSVIDIREDGTINSGARWKRSGRREFSTYSVDTIRDATNVVVEWEVIETTATFDPGIDTFSSTFVQKRFPVTADLTSPNAVPNSTTTGTITAYRFEPSGF